MAQLRTFQIGFLVLWLCCMATAQETAEMVVFDLVPATNDSVPGMMTMSFGSPPQELDVLVAFYTNSEAAAHVPAGALCSTTDNGAGGTWDSIQEPSEGDFVSTSNGSGLVGGVKLVQWEASPDSKTVNISLRKGRGGNAVNVTAIESKFNKYLECLRYFYFILTNADNFSFSTFRRYH